MASTPTPEALEVRRKGRRRLIGAFAIVVAMVVFLPMILDSEPRQRKQELSLPDLFAVRGRYSYTNGVNAKAMVALVLSILPVAPGFVRAALTPGGIVPNPTIFDHLYTYAWFVTFALSAVIYLVLMRGRRS